MEDRLHVEPGGPWREFVDGPLTIRKRSVGPLDNATYLVACTRTRTGVLIDPADEPVAIRAMLDGFAVAAAIVTHGHADHVAAWPALAHAPGLAMWAHHGDSPRLPAEADRWLTDGERFDVGDLVLEVLHVPGHTEGSIVIAVRGAATTHLFTGDTLFPGGPGNTGGDATRHAAIMDGIEDRLFASHDDATRVHPGHGDATTLGDERPRLAEWRARGW